MVFGTAGSGKTTLARELSARTGLPLVERDGLGVLGSEAFRDAIAELVNRPRWILDGAPYYVEDLVYPATDTVIVLDYAKPVVMWRVLRRTLAVELLRRPAGAHRPQGLAALRDSEHAVWWAWTSHRDRHMTSHPATTPAWSRLASPKPPGSSAWPPTPMSRAARGLGYAWSRWRRRHQARARPARRWHHYDALLHSHPRHMTIAERKGDS